MAVRLNVRNNTDGSEGALDFDKDAIVLGQGDGVDLDLPDESVSPEHAQILLHEGQWIVLDVGSATGTLFNGYPLEAQQPVLINPGDVLTLGPFDVQFDLIEGGGMAEPQEQEAYPSTPGGGYGAPAADAYSSPQRDLEAYPPTPGLRFEEEPDASDKTEVVASAFLSKVLGAFGVEEEAPYLTVLNGNNAGLVINIKDMNVDLLLGRSRKANFIIEDECISREHAKIRRDLHGIHIIDLGSRNGVLINGTQVQQIQRLNPGDEVRLGTTRLKFTDPTAAMAAPSSKTPKGPEEEVEGTIIRPTESMEVSEVEALLAQSRPMPPDAALAMPVQQYEQPAAVPYQEPYHEPEPAYAEPEPEPEPPQEQLEEEQLEEEPEAEEDEGLEEEAEEEAEEEEDDLVEEEPEEDEEYAEEDEEESDEEEEAEGEEEEEGQRSPLLVPLIIVAVVLVLFGGVVVVFMMG